MKAIRMQFLRNPVPLQLPYAPLDPNYCYPRLQTRRFPRETTELAPSKESDEENRPTPRADVAVGTLDAVTTRMPTSLPRNPVRLLGQNPRARRTQERPA